MEQQQIVKFKNKHVILDAVSKNYNMTLFYDEYKHRYLNY